MKSVSLVVLGLALSIGSMALAQSKTSSPSSRLWWGKFLDGAQLVSLSDGRQIEVYCEGAGSPLVVLDSGLGDGAWTWSYVQDAIAEKTQVCAFNRAGTGRSSSASGVRDTKAIVQDIEQVLGKAKLAPPYVLVGHSMGGLDMELLAFRRPQDVAGMVLVDPAVEDQFDAFEALAPGTRQKEEAIFTGNHVCALSPRPATAVIKCFSPPPPTLPPRIAAYLSAMQGPRFYRAMEAEAHALEVADSLEVATARRSLGNIPLLVLTSARIDWPDLRDSQRTAIQEWWIKAHERVAALSTSGINRTVPDTTHFIQAQKPEVVVDAVLGVIAKARADRATLESH